jgi:hypothetical protein
MAMRPLTRPGSPREAETRANGAWDRRAGAVLIAATLMLLAGIGLALSHSVQQRSGSDGVKVDRVLGAARPGARLCQGSERIPAGTSELRISVASPPPGPRLLVTLERDGRILRRVPVAAGWSGANLGVPIAPPPRDLDGVEVCIYVDARGSQPLLARGGRTPPHVASLTVDEAGSAFSLRIDDLSPKRRSWWAYLPRIAERLGLGRGAWGGAWIVWLVGSLALAACALAGAIVARTVVADRPLPTARLLLVAGCLNAVVWSLVTPPFQALDEDTHYAYVQEVAERGRPPVDRGQAGYSPALRVLMADTKGGALHLGTDRIAIWTHEEQARLDRDMASPPSPRGNDDAGPADPEPPLYYALAAIPYKLAIGGTPLLRFQLVRLLSTVFAGLTAMLVYLFLRECLPRRRWAWSVGGLAVAFMPMVGAMAGEVNPDGLLYAVSAALFLCLARAFRRGLTTRLALVTGVVLAIGLVGKINFYGLVPGAAVALALAARQTEGAWSGRALRRASIPLAIGLAPFVLMNALDALAWERPAILERQTTSTHHTFHGLGERLAFLWQFYLPRLPWQPRMFPLPVGYELIFKTFVGEFGRLATHFPNWAYRAALGVCAVMGASALRVLCARRTTLRRRRRELLGYGLMAAGLIVLIDLVAYRNWAPTLPGAAQGRYLFPLLPLFGALLALALRGTGERWGRALGVAFVLLCVAWSVFGQLATIAYFYG